MASYDANIVRGVSLELYEDVLDLYIALLPIVNTVKGWTLNSYDPNLPLPFDVKVQLDAYKALKVKSLQLSDWVAALQQAASGDTLSYPPPPVSQASGLVISDAYGLVISEYGIMISGDTWHEGLIVDDDIGIEILDKGITINA